MISEEAGKIETKTPDSQIQDIQTNENENREYLDTVEELQKLIGYLLSRDDIQRIMEELEFIEEKIRKTNTSWYF